MNNTSDSTNAAKPARPITDNPYVGKFFHSTPGNDLDYRGRITARLAKDVYCAEVIFWKDELMPHFRTFDASAMGAWSLFKTQEEMFAHYQAELDKGIEA
jgi:hypothetical protein